MTAFFSKNKRIRSVLVAVATLVLSLCLCLVSACTDDTDSNTNQSTTKTDTATIANGDFEYYTDDDRLELVISPDNWTRSNGQDGNGNSAATSSAASGIVDVRSDLWTDLTEEKSAAWARGENESVSAWMKRVDGIWDSMSTYDRLHFYEALEDAIEEHNNAENDDLAIGDFARYDAYNYEISAEDIPETANPGTHTGAETSEDANAETGVLMIHNYRSDNYGTAQRYTASASVTLTANTSAKVSVWVKTADLTYSNGDVNGNRGANICVTHTVGGKTLDQMQIKNIDTKGVTENNGWVQYTVYIKACAFASSTFTVELGLGRGGSGDAFEYVQGYAFFDDVEMETISNEEYDAATKNGDDYKVPFVTLRSSADEKIFKADTAAYKDKHVYAIDLYESLEPFTVGETGNAADVTVDVGLTATRVNGVDYTTDNYTGLGISKEGDLTGLLSWNELNGQTASNKYLSSIWSKDFDTEKYPFDKDQDMIFLLSAHGAAYTAKMDATGDLFTLQPDEYMMLSFWVKTSDTSGFTGATVNVYDETTATALGPYNTTTLSTTDLDGQEDIFDGWVQCFIFVGNDTLTEKSFRLEFSYGPTTITGTTKTSYSEGYAAFTSFEAYELTKAEYDTYAGTTAQSTSVSLVGSDANGEGFDSVSTTDEQKIETAPANPSEYKGVNGNSIWVSSDPVSSDVNDESNRTNANENAGLINRNYVGGYEAEATDGGWLHNLINAYTGAQYSSVTDALAAMGNWWNTIFGSSTQPLLISNVVEQSYGYIGSSNNLSANGYSTVSVRVMVSAGAKAYIYLIDTSDIFAGYDNTANITTANVTYWYDDDGNVVKSDPDGDGFNALRDIAFTRADNGLFRNSMDTTDTAYYANLSNYEKDEDGNLIAKTDSDGDPQISYNYSDDYHDDGVAFYYNEADQKYYAYRDAATGEYDTEVKDFSAVTVTVGSETKSFTAAYARYISEDYLATLNVTAANLGEDVTLTNTADTSAFIVVDGTQSGVANQWVTVRFYIHTGGDSFPYRLEVFSGARDGSDPNPAGSFVAFDECGSDALSENYDGLLDEAIDTMTDENGYTDSRLNGTTVTLEEDEETGRLVYADGEKAGQTYENAQYYAYTFYDDAAYRRFDSTLDENKLGDPYEAYVQSSNKEELTYLYYETSLGGESVYSMFLNYNAVHQSVEADEGLETDDEETTDNWWEDPDFWLMLSSIILAVVLILVLIIMLIVKLVGRVGKKTASKGRNRYDAKRARYIRKLNLQTEEDDETESKADAEKEDVTADNDENPYND